MDWSIIVLPALVLGLFGVIFAVGVGLIYLVLQIYIGEVRRCPNCQKRRAAVLSHTDEISARSYIDSGAVARMARGTGKWVKPDRITETTYQDYYVCKFCDHTWSKTIQERKRDPS